MKIEDKFELMALHRCLLEAKFNPNPNDRDIAGSPIVAKLINQLTDELEKIEGKSWEEWRVAENHIDRVKNLVVALKKSNLDGFEDIDSQSSLVISALAPLKAEEKTIKNIINEVFGDNKSI